MLSQKTSHIARAALRKCAGRPGLAPPQRQRGRVVVTPLHGIAIPCSAMRSATLPCPGHLVPAAGACRSLPASPAARPTSLSWRTAPTAICHSVTDWRTSARSANTRWRRRRRAARGAPRGQPPAHSSGAIWKHPRPSARPPRRRHAPGRCRGDTLLGGCLTRALAGCTTRCRSLLACTARTGSGGCSCSNRQIASSRL